MNTLLFIPAATIGVTALVVLAHDVRQLALTGYLALPTTVAAAFAVGVAVTLTCYAT